MKSMKNMWNQRYSENGFAYGTAPNKYFFEKIKTLKPGKILLPAEGEGRNGVLAASLGWQVHAFDISDKAKVKAETLAKQNNVELKYDVGTIEEIHIPKNNFDAVGLIYAHFPLNVKLKYYKILIESLKIGGHIILEGFSKNHLEVNLANKYSMGPQNKEMLFSIDEIKDEFSNFQIVELLEKQVILNEGVYHKGLGSVIRFFGKKLT